MQVSSQPALHDAVRVEYLSSDDSLPCDTKCRRTCCLHARPKVSCPPVLGLVVALQVHPAAEVVWALNVTPAALSAQCNLWQGGAAAAAAAADMPQHGFN